jgi:16S rRNA (guanine527-N7)-methyltransferase
MSADGSEKGGGGVGSPEWKRLLIEGAAGLGFRLDDGQVGLFRVYAEELLAWNRRINLTTITRPADIAVKHFIDSLPGAKALKPGWRILDLGSGGGFPGIPLKIVRPDLKVTLVDAVRKKVSFQKQVCRQLGLGEVQCVHARIEALGDDPHHKGVYDAVVSRALTDLGALCRLAAPLLGAHGLVIAYRGRSDEMGGGGSPLERALADNWHMENHPYLLPYGEAHRRITCCKRRPV